MERGFLSSGSKDKNKKGGSKEKGTTMVIDAPMVNDDGDLENPWKTCPNSASDGVVPILTPSLEKDIVLVYLHDAMKVESPSVVEETVEKEKLSHVSSYAKVTGKPSGKKVNVRTLFTPGGNGIDVIVLVDSIRAISERFANTAYGFFLGKKVAYPVVANYVRNTWGKYGLIRSMFSSSTGLFSFQFSSMDGLEAMLENVWVKLHGVPVTAFSEDGLSAIATKLGTPLMLDSYTSDMCMQSWGRSSYARVMIELRADVELKDNIVVAMHKITREGHYTRNVRVEYEWKPPRCSSCKVFGHIHEECPKNTGVGEKKTMKKPSQTSRGVPVGPKMDFKPQKEYRPIPKKPNASSSGNKKKGVEPTIELTSVKEQYLFHKAESYLLAYDIVNRRDEAVQKQKRCSVNVQRKRFQEVNFKKLALSMKCFIRSIDKTSAVYEKTSPISDLRWKPTGRIFNTVGLRWVPIRKILASCTSKDDIELTHGSNVDIPNIHEHVTGYSGHKGGGHVALADTF
ncbi:retrotransposon protein, putative, ty1-copia subclass [Tanacetum coccineum]